MTTDYSNQNLRDRSFQQQVLNQANFSGSDLRGCNFQGAQLVGANFERVKTGWTFQQLVKVLGVAIVTLCGVIYALFHLISAALGQTVGDRGWSFVLVLYGALFLSGTGAVVRAIGRRSPQQRSLLTFSALLSLSASAALLGFFYAGTAADHEASVAIGGAIMGGIVGAVLGIWYKKPIVAIVMMTAGMVANYGFALMVGGMAIAWLSGQNWFWGVPLAIVTLFYLGFTIVCGEAVLQQMRHHWGTSFRDADLTDANFHQADLQGADFRGAIGVIPQRRTKGH